MSSKIRLFLWLSALLAGLGAIGVAENLADIALALGHGKIKEAVQSDEIPQFTQLHKGLITMGVLLIVSNTLLFLRGRKLKTSGYWLLFLLTLIVSLLSGAAVASLV